ncbi:MAG: sulfotransferase family protein [Cypionkella sp.]|jgi:hypothetical protein|nr:sulfotransferase family protein [Cypionkella sp.]
MLISVKHKFLFVANTKAASTSIEAILGPYAEISRPGGPQGKHLPLSKIRYDYRFLFTTPDHPFESFFRFGVMREPMDWILSWFRYRRGNQVAAPLPADMSFEQFWRAGDWNIRNGQGAPYCQSTIFLDQQGAPLADMILPYASLDDDLPPVLAGMGIHARIPRLNVSVIPPDQARIPPHLIDEIRAHYAADYALWSRLRDINAAGLARLNRATPHSA